MSLKHYKNFIILSTILWNSWANGADAVIYDDAVAAGWQAGVWNCTSFNLQTTPRGRTGVYALQVKEACAWGGFGFDHRSADWSSITYHTPSEFSYLDFDILPAKTAQINDLYLTLGTGITKAIKPYVTSTTSSGWSHAHIPINELTSERFFQIFWQSGRSSGQTFYLDNVKLTPGSSINYPPIAQTSAIPSSGVSPLPVTLNGGGSSDPDGDAPSYHWTFGDGGTASEATVAHTYVNTGTSVQNFTAILTVNDGRGGVSRQQQCCDCC